MIDEEENKPEQNRGVCLLRECYPSIQTRIEVTLFNMREVQRSGFIITKKGPGEADSDVGRRNLGINNINELMIWLILTM